ncbi:MAG: glycosyltransferase family 2 protein [bacterium]
MLPVSATIITYNEEENISACLESIRWVDEILVVDSFSNDKTIEICEGFGCKVYRHKWLGYGKQKNLAINRAKNEWILSLDADERISPELQREIKCLIQKCPEKDGYYIPRKAFFSGKWIRHCGWYPDYNLRLFNRHKGKFKERAVHECVELNGEVGYLKGNIEHYTYKSISDFLERLDRYSSLAAEEMFKGGTEFKGSQLVFRPIFNFFKMYILKLGFLDGYDGFLLSVLYSYYVFVKYCKLQER